MASVQDLVKQILLAAHPVGSYYWSSESADPGTLFGGAWERVKDVFVLAAGDTYAAGATGGEASVRLTQQTMPAHSHGYYLDTTKKGAPGGSDWFVDAGTIGEEKGRLRTTEQTGGNQPHNNMPPYITAFCWRRTA